MKRFKTSAALLIAATSLPLAVQADNVKRIKKESDFNAIVVGKKLKRNGSWIRIKADGSQDGRVDGKKFVSKWVWSKRMYCRNAVFGDKALGTDCLVVSANDDGVEFIRNEGKGQVSFWTFD